MCFPSSQEDFDGSREKPKLSRRDTPHYLKNKRIQEPQDKEKAMALINSVLQKKDSQGLPTHPQQPQQQVSSSSNHSEDEERLPTPPPPPDHGEVV